MKKIIVYIATRHRTIPLTLRSCRRYSDGVVRLHYVVERNASRGESGKRGMA